MQMEGNNANANDAIMLDKDGYVSETNATNIFLVKKGRVLTPHADYCLPGITRATIMELVVKEKFELVERRISLSEFHAADEVLQDFLGNPKSFLGMVLEFPLYPETKLKMEGTRVLIGLWIGGVGTGGIRYTIHAPV
ncbi:hypothetical protein GOBAR_DD34837 [Gossypium barbadense]|nr:hypothetical protein GOBAR_DD34837 [Gossypium barbadense]